MRASRHSTLARVAQPATRVDTTCWQLFRPRYQYSPFLFFVAEVMSSYLTTDGLKNFFSTSGGPWGLRPVAFATPATWLIRHWSKYRPMYKKLLEACLQQLDGKIATVAAVLQLVRFLAVSDGTERDRKQHRTSQVQVLRVLRHQP